ncbi:MAG TPA: adenine phosphoribosyltransferase [Acidimicrobiia bacterium]|nr:adenine phosphoribosyltransferase [Acidimicrobiia bacterium]
MTEAALHALIREVYDFPTPGIVFKDITPILSDHAAFDGAIDLMLAPFVGTGVSKVAGIEARGFMFAAPIAARLGAGFIPIRKPGKLPCEVVEQEYDLEYGTDKLQIHADAVHDGERVLIVDDVLATGGTAAASIDLLQQVGADVVGLAVLLELEFLSGRKRTGDVLVHAVVRDGAD